MEELNLLDNIKNKAAEEIIIALGKSIAITGICVGRLSEVVIVLGILLWFYKITKVFRYGCIGYSAGLILEIIGSLMIK